MAKKYVLIPALVMVLLFSGIAYAISPITIYVNGKEVKSDVPAYINQGRTMVPIRFVSEALGAKVDWDAKTRRVVITTPETKTSPLLKLNGEQTTWPYWYEDGKLYMEYRNTLQLLREYAPYNLYYNKQSHELFINDRNHYVDYRIKGSYTVLSLTQLRDFKDIVFVFDPDTGNLTFVR